MKLEKAIEIALDGEAIIFTGAGFSVGTKNILNEDIPVAGKLSSEYLSKDLKLPKPSNDLGLVSDLYIEKIGTEPLIEKLQNLYICKSMKEDDSQSIIASVPWSRVYTTNYDDVFEKSSSIKGINRIPVTLNKLAQEYSNKNVILHLNGFINDLSAKTLFSEFKLSKTSYLAESFKESKSRWYDIFKSDLDAASAIIFVGVSFEYDIDLQEIIYNSENFKDKIIFIDRALPTDHDPNDITFNYYKKKFGNVYNIGVDEFANQIEEVSQKYIPNSKEKNYSCFKKVTEGDFQELSSNNLRELLKLGYINHNLAYFNRNNNKYLINRKEIDDIISSLNQGIKCACIVAGMSNGKTSLLTLLSNRLSELGNVYSYTGSNDNLSKEIKDIGNHKVPVYIILENYNQNLDILYKFRSILMRPNIHLIVTARSFIHDTRKFSLVKNTGLSENDIREIYIDTIDKDDLDYLVELLDASDYFLEFKDKSLNFKKRKITGAWNSQFSDILIELIKSPVIEKEIGILYNNISKNKLMEELVLMTCIFKVFDIPLALNDFQNILKTKNLPISFYNDESLNQFIRPANNEINMQSTILARYIINKFGQNNLLNILNVINENVDSISDLNKIESIKEAIVSFSNLSLLIDRKRNIVDFQNIVEFYYKIRNNSFYKKNEFFWLQFAIACMEAKDYERAFANLNLAYKLGKEKNPLFDTFQMDTQYARFLLETDLEDEQDSYKRFEKAHNLLRKVIKSDKGQQHLIFKQVSKYPTYYARHKDNISNPNKNKIINANKYFIEIMDEYLKNDKNTKELPKTTNRRIMELNELNELILKDGVIARV